MISKRIRAHQEPRNCPEWMAIECGKEPIESFTQLMMGNDSSESIVWVTEKIYTGINYRRGSTEAVN